MLPRIAALSLLLSFASAAGAADKPVIDPAVQWMARLMVGTSASKPFTRDVAERRLLLVLTAANAADASVPENQGTIFRPEENVFIARRRAGIIAEVLAKDLDNDGKVTSEELRIVLGPTASMNLISNSGVKIQPTPEQVEEILQQLMDRDLQTDTNRDGTIDFDEMRSAAMLAVNEPQINRYTFRANAYRVSSHEIFKLLDTSQDQKISSDEFLAAIRKTFTAVDLDKNGTVSEEEARPYTLPRNTF